MNAAEFAAALRRDARRRVITGAPTPRGMSSRTGAWLLILVVVPLHVLATALIVWAYFLGRGE